MGHMAGAITLSLAAVSVSKFKFHFEERNLSAMLYRNLIQIYI